MLLPASSLRYDFRPRPATATAARGSSTPTTRAVPVVGCFVHDRFVLSWAGMRCRSMTDAPFPAECDGAGQRNVLAGRGHRRREIVPRDSLTQEGRNHRSSAQPSLLHQRTRRLRAPTDGDSQHDVVRLVVGELEFDWSTGWAVQG